MNYTIDNFPALRDFCREHEISSALTYNPCYHIVKFIFKYDRRTFSRNFDEGELNKRWIPAIEKELINVIKKEFDIYESAVEEHMTLKEWSKREDTYSLFNERTPWFPYGEYNKTVKIGKDEDKMKRNEMIALPKGFGNFNMVGIKKVIFNDPATIIIWSDDVKTVVKAENEPYDPEKGMAVAIAKRALGNEGNYYNIFRKWLPKKDKTSSMKEMAEKLTNMMLDPKVSPDEYKEAVTESIILINSFKKDNKEPEVIGKIKDVKKTDDGVVVEAEITDDVDSTFKDSFF